MRAIVLRFLQLQLQPLLLAPRLLEAIIAARVESEPPLVQMQDTVDRLVQEIAVVADDQHRMRIGGDEILKPEHAFEIEIVRRLVEEQDIGLCEQPARQRDPHAPSAGELGAGALMRLFIETEPGKNPGRASGGGMRIDIAEPRVDFADAMRIVGRLGLRSERGQLGVRRQHRFEQRLRATRRFLRNMREPGILGKADGPVIGMKLTRNQAQERGLARAVAPDKADFMPFGNGDGRVLEKRPPFDAEAQIIDMQHRRKMLRKRRPRNPLCNVDRSALS